MSNHGFSRVRTSWILISACLLISTAQGCERHFATEATPYVAEYCKVWGFLKYYHPNVVRGQINWDSVFIAHYAEISRATNRHLSSEVIAALVRDAGGVRSFGTLTIYLPDTVCLIDRTWLSDTGYIEPQLARELDSVRSNRVPQSEAGYVGAMPPKNAEFRNDTLFYSQKNLPEAVRILALARYWNIINYFAPDKDVIGTPWDSVLLAFIPQVVAADRLEDYTSVLKRCCCAIHDSHSFTRSIFVDPSTERLLLPFRLEEIEGKAIVARSDTHQLSKGDEVLSIDGVSIDSLRRRFSDVVPASNEAARSRNIFRSLRLRARPDSVEVSYRTPTGLKHCMVAPHQFDEREAMTSTTKPWKILDGNIGYLDLGKLTKADVDEAMLGLLKTKAIIFDVRNYPQGTMYEIGKYLDVTWPWVSFRSPVMSEPGVFQLEKFEVPFHKEATQYTGHIVILVNEMTQSHAEFTCMLLQAASNAIVIGSQTAGADGNVSEVRLPGGITTMFSGLGVFYPDGRPTQRVGIVPDIEVHPTIAGIRAGRDEVLDKAISTIQDPQH